jgi:hypothetical protein
MNGACLGIYRKERLDESFREVFRKYQKHIIEDTCWFSIELEYHLKPTYTKFETKKLTDVFGCFPEQVIWIFGESDRIFVASHEIIKHFGGLLGVPLAPDRDKINSCTGLTIPIQKKRYKYPGKHNVDYWLVDHIFIRNYFEGLEDKFDRFKLAPFLPVA